MAHCERASKPLLQCLRATYVRGLPGLQAQSTRSFQSSAVPREEAQEPQTKRRSFYENPDPALASSPKVEKKLMREGVMPVGSRRRRAALQHSSNIPFEQLPYQCFQDARQVLLADREEKLKEIESVRAKLSRFEARPVEEAGGEEAKKLRVVQLQQYLERLKILADINDPLVKKRFEDGLGDMSKPIYRFLADKKWREYRRKILVQRITQMKVIPDVLPECDPVAETQLFFGNRTVQPGEFVNSKLSTTAPRMNVQLFERGQKLVTIAVIDPDVPNVEKDGYDYKMHYLAVNIPLSATSTKVDLGQLSPESQVVLPWEPPVAQKGSPYHRLSIFVLEQQDAQPLDFAAVKAKEAVRENMTLRDVQARYQLKPIGAHLFRTQWDETMLEVMKQVGFAQPDLELRTKRVEPLPYKRRNPSTFR